MEDSRGTAMIGPLVFNSTDNSSGKTTQDTTPGECQCLLCETTYDIQTKAGKDEFLRHLVHVHKIVIADVPLIADLVKYISYWKERMQGKAITDFCSAIKTNTSADDQALPEIYYLLCDVLPEDKQLRITLQKEKLDVVLTQQQKEREDTLFDHGCLFCRTEFTGNRNDLFRHMQEEHNFNVGHCDNLVYTDEYLDVLNKKLHSLQCLYCEHIFKDRQVLKEHMRKKGHKRINPKNPAYDKFYVVNYLELGKNWETIQSEDDDNQSIQSNSDDWSDWRHEGGGALRSVCLFCEHGEETMDQTQVHMKEKHAFDLKAIKTELNLTFYQQVKLVNYIRRQIYQHTCMVCEEKCVNRDSLERHWQESGHTAAVPPPSHWDQPQYYFPTYENDNLLCGLDDEEEGYASGNMSDEAIHSCVIAEDFSVRQSMLKDKSVLKDLVASAPS